ncbi:MAG: 50S ribosomal protein L9 [SAR86 cluster bacterium]|nr:50S ribosomal protein L9 [SAR86 cluster bacterium]
MDLILLETVLNLGDPGDLVTVKKGYARNFLIPNGKAILASDEAKEEFEAKRELIEKSELGKIKEANNIAEKLKDYELELFVPVSEEQSLYGSIGTREISEGLKKSDFDVDIQSIRLPLGTFKELGSYEVDIELHPKVVQKITIIIKPEE